MRYKPSWWYISIFGVFTKWYGVFMMEHYIENASFLSSIPFDLISMLFIAFVFGLLAQDVSNPESWLRKNRRELKKMFEIESIVPANNNDNAHSWLEITVHLKFIRDIKDVEIIVRAHSNYTLEHAKDVFLISTNAIASIHKDHSEKIVLGIIPLESHDGSPVGYQVWGDKYRKSGDVSGMKSLSSPSNNLVEITVKCKKHEQTEKVFLCMSSHRGGELGKYFVMHGGDGINGNRKVLEFRRSS